MRNYKTGDIIVIQLTGGSQDDPFYGMYAICRVDHGQSGDKGHHLRDTYLYHDGQWRRWAFRNTNRTDATGRPVRPSPWREEDRTFHSYHPSKADVVETLRKHGLAARDDETGELVPPPAGG